MEKKLNDQQIAIFQGIAGQRCLNIIENFCDRVDICIKILRSKNPLVALNRYVENIDSEISFVDIVNQCAILKDFIDEPTAEKAEDLNFTDREIIEYTKKLGQE